MDRSLNGSGHFGNGNRLHPLRQEAALPFSPLSPSSQFDGKAPAKSERDGSNAVVAAEAIPRIRSRNSGSERSGAERGQEQVESKRKSNGKLESNTRDVEATNSKGFFKQQGDGKSEQRAGQSSRERERRPSESLAEASTLSGPLDVQRERASRKGSVQALQSATLRKEAPKQAAAMLREEEQRGRKVRSTIEGERKQEEGTDQPQRERQQKSRGAEEQSTAEDEDRRRRRDGPSTADVDERRKSSDEKLTAEEVERRRRREERRIKRAEKEARREARVRREKKGSGTEQTKRRRDSKDSYEEALAVSRRDEEIVFGGRHETLRQGKTFSARHAERMLNGEMVRNEKLEGRGTKSFQEKREAQGALEEHSEKVNDSGLRDGISRGEHTKGAGRETSFMNEIYEETDEANLLHATFKYDGATGQLTNTMATSMIGTEGKKQRLYIEGVTTGNFHRTHASDQGEGSTWRWLRPATWQRGDEDDVEVGTSSGILLRVACEQIAGTLALLAHFSNSLLGGFALLNFYITYLYNAGSLPGGFLAYYTPVAVTCQRSFLVLSSICLLAACDKYAKDKLADWKPRGNVQWRHDLLVILAFFLAFVLSVVGAPFEDYVFNKSIQSPDWYTTVGSTAHFKARLKAWHVLNFVRLGACAVGFLVVTMDGNTALRLVTRVKNVQATCIQPSSAGAAALANSLVRANALTQSMQTTRSNFR